MFFALISMLWHRQAISESKLNELFSSAECRIRTQGLRHHIVSRVIARWQIDWAIENQAKNLRQNIHAKLVCVYFWNCAICFGINICTITRHYTDDHTHENSFRKLWRLNPVKAGLCITLYSSSPSVVDNLSPGLDNYDWLVAANKLFAIVHVPWRPQLIWALEVNYI